MSLKQVVRSGVSAESQALIDAFIRRNGVTQVQPSGVPGNEAPRHTRELIAKTRREWRKAQKTK